MPTGNRIEDDNASARRLRFVSASVPATLLNFFHAVAFCALFGESPRTRPPYLHVLSVGVLARLKLCTIQRSKKNCCVNFDVSLEDMEKRFVTVPGAQLQVSLWDSGEPVVFIQTALTADELRPLAAAPVLDGYRKVLYYRRGYEGSSPTKGAGSIARDSADCAALLSELQIDRAHVVGLSYSGAVALQLAADAPELTHTLTLIEPPPVHTPSAPEFRATNHRLVKTRRRQGPGAALEEFLTLVIGRNWHQVAEDQLPGSSVQMRRDTATFFDADLPALLDWEFEREDASGISCPVLYVGGIDSGPWFAEVRELILSWFPHAEDVAIEGADHSLALTHAAQIAEALVAFLRRHPMGY